MPTASPRYQLSNAELLALALSHRLQAERSACPAEQLELHRVADIYEVLATLDFPFSTFAEVEGLISANNGQFVDVFE